MSTQTGYTHEEVEGILARAAVIRAERDELRRQRDLLLAAHKQISVLWPMPPNCADVLAVNGINDGKGRAILLGAALDISHAAIAQAEQVMQP